MIQHSHARGATAACPDTNIDTMDFLHTRSPPNPPLGQPLFEMDAWEQGTNRELMLVDWLCVDFRQKLLNVLCTSSPNNFNEARDLVMEKLLDLLERMTTSKDSHNLLFASQPLDFHPPTTPLPLLPTTPDPLQYSNDRDELCPPLPFPTPDPQGTSVPGHSRCPSRSSPADPGIPSYTVVPSPMSLDNGLLPGCADFVDFNLLADGNVFSIGVYDESGSNAVGFQPAVEFHQEMDVDPDVPAVPSSDIHTPHTSTHTTHTSPPPHTSPPARTPMPSPPVTRSAQKHKSLQPPQPNTTRPEPTNTTHRPANTEPRQRHTSVGPRAMSRAITVTQTETETETQNPSLYSPSWTHIHPEHLPSPETVLATFTHHLGDSKQSAALLTRLFYAIGSPDALTQLRHAVRLGRAKNSTMPVHSTNDLATTVQVLDHLDSVTTLSHILRRYYLVRLLEHRTRLEHTHITAKLAWRRSKRMLKYDPARVDLMKRGEALDDGKNPTRDRDREPKYRSKSQALADLMHMLYPDLTPQDSLYSVRLTKLRNRLSCARNWYKFEQAFPGGILALIPCAGRFSVSIDQIEKLPSNIIQMFLGYLQEHRGSFLRCISETLSTELFGVLARTDMTPAFMFEKVEEDSIGDLLYDTDQLISMCEVDRST
ncbi:hypothetical protein BJX99DRAFT_264511 [Aspergillus californicus]